MMDETESTYFACVADPNGMGRCGLPALKTAPISICRKHLLELLDFYRDDLAPTTVNNVKSRITSDEADHDWAERQEQRRLQMAEQSVVYYARIGDVIKIGYTSNLRQRLGALRIYDEDLLATEPGGRERETERHAQFMGERIDPRREDFRPSKQLTSHIAQLVAIFGPPVITTYRTGGKADQRRSEKRRFRPTVRDI
jgi:hypothetical protein